MLKQHQLYACITLIITALLMPALHADELFNSSETSDTRFLLDANTLEFLPIEEAYQLDAVIEQGNAQNNQQLNLRWTAAPGYYLYQHRFKFLDSTGKTLSVSPGFQSGTFKYDEYYERDLEVFYENTLITLPLSSLPNKFQVESQACADAGLCYPPRRQAININPLTQQATVQEIQNGALVVDKNSFAAPFTEEPATPLILILLFALLGGAILNLMPCVFPVLSIKALSMTNSSIDRQSRHIHGLVYTAGVITAFTAVAALLIVLRDAGSAVGWGFQLQSPLFVGALVYLFTLMGFGFSGFFEFSPRLMGIGQTVSSGHSLPATFMTGVLATVVASPCTAPFMGTAVGFAITQSTTTALLVFVFLGLGMALPFLLLSWWPGLAKKMPQPGPWMDRFKQFLAFPLYLSALWLLWVLGHQTSIDTVVALMIGVVFMGLAIWLFRASRRGALHLLRLALITALLVSAVVLPVSTYNQQRNQEAAPWQPYTESHLKRLREKQQPVFVNLTADWCITCLANEKLALNSKKFLKALSNKQVTYLKGDWTTYNPEITKLLNENGRNSVPLYLVYPSGPGKPSLLPQLLTESIVIDALNTIEP